MSPPQVLAFPPTALRQVPAGRVVGNPVGSSGTRAKALTSEELKAIIEASGPSYLPLTGGALNGGLSTTGRLTSTVSENVGNIVGRVVLGNSNTGIWNTGGNSLVLAPSGIMTTHISSTLTRYWSDMQIQWAGIVNNGTQLGSAAADLILLRGGPGILHQRNGLNAQTYEIFETYTSATSYGSLCLKATASGHQIGSARGSAGGSNRAVQLGHFDSAGAFTRGLDVLTNGTVRVGTDANEYIELGVTTNSRIAAWSNALGFHYMIIGDSTGSGGPMIFRIGAQGTLEWQNTNRSDAGTSDLAVGRASAGLLGIYTDNTRATLASLSCSAITASGNLNLTTLPTSDPGVPGRVWRDGTNLRISV